MADVSAYRCVFAEDVADFIVAQPKGKQRRILMLAKALAQRPQRISDYTVRDEAGREIENIVLERWVFSYWIDHAVKEVRIVDLVEA